MLLYGYLYCWCVLGVYDDESECCCIGVVVCDVGDV